MKASFNSNRIVQEGWRGEEGKPLYHSNRE
jgi:hypothetical protein